MSNGSASSARVASPARRRSRMARLVGSARAAKVMLSSSVAVYIKKELYQGEALIANGIRALSVGRKVGEECIE